MMLSSIGSGLQFQAAARADAYKNRLTEEFEDILRQSLAASMQRSRNGKNWHFRHVPLIRAHEARNGAV